MSWDLYYEKNKGRPVRELYSIAIQFVSASAKVAVDLGCGNGIEVFDLLQRGFEVHAVDQEKKAIDLIKEKLLSNSGKFIGYASSIEAWTAWPKTDLLFAHHSYPFCFESSFKSVLQKSINSIIKDGIFAASFFGFEDQWVIEKKARGLHSDEVKAMLSGFEILHFNEIKKKGPTALQGDKFWHVIEVVAKRI